MTQSTRQTTHMNTPEYICKKCGVAYPETTEFFFANGRYLERKCKKCRNRDQQNLLRKKKYGVSPEDFETLRKEQEGRCGICGIAEENLLYESLHVDHSHKTGLVRGLLCFYCNVGIGHFKEDINRLQSAIKYLESKNE